MLQCKCGFSSPEGRQLLRHKFHCPQWKEYSKTIAADATILKQRAEKDGVSAIATELGVGASWLGRLLGIYSDRKRSLHPKPITTITLSPREILDAIRTLAEEHSAGLTTVAMLQQQLKNKDVQILRLQVALGQTTKALEELRGATLAPIKIRIDREISQQAHDSH